MFTNLEYSQESLVSIEKWFETCFSFLIILNVVYIIWIIIENYRAKKLLKAKEAR